MERNPDSPGPRLLVSVRSLAEAQEAIAGGCDILDIKEPSRGSLGAAAGSVIGEIAECSAAAGLQVSAALGECVEWRATNPVDLDSISGLDFVKFGMAGLGNSEKGLHEWLQLLGTIARHPEAHTRHVAVVYADWQAAAAPHPQQVLSALATHIAGGKREPVFAGVLVDTFEKSSGRLPDTMCLDTLREIRERSTELGLFLALAGRLNIESLGQVLIAEPDIVAIRSAACGGGDRCASVHREAVRAFRFALQKQLTRVESHRDSTHSSLDEASHA